MRKTTAAAIAAAALISPAPASAACAGADSQPDQLDGPGRVVSVRCLINEQRAAHGVRALRADARLAAAAPPPRRAGARRGAPPRRHSADMVAHHYFAHDSRSGASFSARIAETGWTRRHPRWFLGENLGWGTGGLATPRAIVKAWMTSPPHRETLLNGSYRTVGIGVSLGAPVRDA